MLKKNISKMIISSVILLLPILYGVIMWDSLPDVITTHWGVDGNADGFGSKAFAVFGLPVILLAFHAVCLLFTSLDKKQKEQNQKALGMIFWIIPAISLFTNAIMYRAAFGKEINFAFLMPALMGAMFLFVGNYLPKVKQNSTLGIKMSWTLNNEENWNKTHRFAGKVWVVGGIAILLCMFLPLAVMVWAVLSITIVMVILPVAYSYGVFRQHQKQGIVYAAAPKSKAEKIASRIAAVVVPLILVGITLVMFTGNVQVQCGDTSFQIHATYWTDMQVDYSRVDTVEYRKDLEVGVRASGFASARLSLGAFQNEEFGVYTLYAYTGAKAFVVLTSGEKTLVIGLRDTEAAQTIYQTVLSKIAE